MTHGPGHTPKQALPGPQRSFKMIRSFVLSSLLLAASAVAGESLVGMPAPDFELEDQKGRLQALEDYRGRWIVLYFYPKNGTPGCTTEACEFRDNVFAYRDLNAQILGVSLDDAESHKAFAEKHGLPFPLLADDGGDVAETYGVKTRMFGFTVAKRETFLIGPDGTVVKHYAEVKPATHSAQVLADLKVLIGEPEDAEPEASVASEGP